MASEEPRDDRCAAKCRGPREGLYCEQYPINNTGRCKMHGGLSTGPPEGTQNALANDGGAPPLNDNAMKHGLRADRSKFYKRLSEERQRSIDRFEAALIERYQDYHGRDPDPADVKDLFEIAVGYVQRDYARDWLADQMDETDNPMLEHVKMQNDDGTTTEFDKPNQILESIEDMRREDRMQRKDKGLESGPDDQAAENLGTIADILSSTSEGE